MMVDRMHDDLALLVLDYFKSGAAREDMEVIMPPDTPEGKYTFYKDQREHIKSRSMLPSDTLRYIEALEAVAEAAFNLWIQVGSPRQKEMADDLYDALAVVDFLSDEEH